MATLFASILDLGSAACVALACVALVKVALLNDTPYPFRWLIILVASLQWGVAPTIAYATNPFAHYRYFMYVDAENYFSVAAPGIFALAVGLFVAVGRQETPSLHYALERVEALVRKRPRLPLMLLAAGFGATALGLALPASLSFVAYLLTQLKFAGILLLLMSGRPDRFFWISWVFVLLLVEAAASSMFHTIFLWSAVIGIFTAWRYRVPAWSRIGLIALVAFSGFIIQSMKHEYRAQAWQGGEGGSGIFIDMALDRMANMLEGVADIDGALQSALIRVNQGWIISAVIGHTPAVEPYAEGETVKDAMLATFLPRYLMPSKAEAGGAENFSRFTGLDLGRSTSMNISILGEAYANFGATGGAVFLFLFGVGISLVLRFASVIFRSWPFFVVLMPITMMQAIKAETDLVTVMNYVFKAAILMLLIAYVVQRWLWRAPRQRGATR
jgi:hypothetical protein